jgi:uncharacterized iron-regulated protein
MLPGDAMSVRSSILRHTASGLAARTVLFSLFLTLIAAGYLQAGGNPPGTKVLRLTDRKVISHAEMVDDLRKAGLVLVGEMHDREAHHRMQLDIIKALKTAKVPIAVGFEMFTYESQKDIESWVAGTMPESDFISAYYRNWNFPWPLYDDIFLYIRDNKIPAIALNVPPEITRKVSASGFSSLTREERAKLPPETGCAVDEQYMKFIRRAHAMHGHGGKNFIYFCEAQLLWDQVMARSVIEYLKKDPGKTVVVITGNGHAWKRGIPEQVRLLSEKTAVRVVLPNIPGHIDPGHLTTEDADYILLQ